jgi:hypothetical protein
MRASAPGRIRARSRPATLNYLSIYQIPVIRPLFTARFLQANRIRLSFFPQEILRLFSDPPPSLPIRGSRGCSFRDSPGSFLRMKAPAVRGSAGASFLCWLNRSSTSPAANLHDNGSGHAKPLPGRPVPDGSGHAKPLPGRPVPDGSGHAKPLPVRASHLSSPRQPMHKVVRRPRPRKLHLAIL